MAFHNKVWNNSTVFPHFPQLVKSGVLVNSLIISDVTCLRVFWHGSCPYYQ